MLQRALQTPWILAQQLSWRDCEEIEVGGGTTPDFAPLTDVIRRIVAQYSGGAAIAVYHRGELVADLWAGERDSTGAPWKRDTLAPSFSTTKGVAATALHIMVDRGLMNYDDPVARYWPEFAQRGKDAITVRHVLAHQSGLYHIRQMIDRADRMLDWEYMIHAIECAEPIHTPGERTGYHGLTFGFIVGELVQRVSGQRFSEVIREQIASPLGLEGMYIGAPDEALTRAARLLRSTSVWESFARPLIRTASADQIAVQSLVALVRIAQRGLNLGGVPVDVESVLDALAPRGISSFDFSADEALRATIPAANGLFNARSLARMYATLAAGGELDGVRLLSTGTLLEAAKRQERTAKLHVIPFDMRWRLGYHGVVTSRGFLPHAFGHFGLGGSGAWACPENQLAVALVVNSGVGTPFGDLRVVRVGGVALSCARARHAWARAEPLN